MAEKEKDILAPLEEEETSIPEPETSEPIHNDLTEGSDRYPDVYFELIPDRIVEVEKETSAFLFRCENKISLSLQVLSETIFRLRYSLDGAFQRDFSYALDPQFKAANVEVAFSNAADHYQIKTSALTCRIGKQGMKVDFYDPEGQPVCQEAEGFKGVKTILKGITSLSISKKAQPEEHYFGLGDKSCNTNLRGHRLENWNTDAFAFDKEMDPLYRSIPFYYGLQSGQAYGIFLDNSYRSHFDFDSQKEGSCTFSAAGGEMNYYFLYGPELLSVAQQYTDLTGRPDLPPLWALGFHQCRWSYYPEQRVREVCTEFRQRQIPCDAIYLDIDYMDDYRCFTWDQKHFPQPTQMISDLRKQGFQTVVMIDPGIKIDPDYQVYQQGMEQDLFCRRPDGDLMTGPVWPPDCVFPDFTNPRTREWWASLYQGLYQENGVSGFWNDMNEPAVFKVNAKTFPEDVRHDHDGQPCSHAKVHNIYGLLMSRSTIEGLQAIRPEHRPFIITRATFSGGQRYASSWTGDNVSSWEHLRLANIQCQRMSISGFSFIGTDIGGFVDQPTGELMVRWLQLGIFHPLYRVHSMGNNTDGATEVDEELVKKSEAERRMDQEPWSFGDTYTELAKKTIEFRYRLLPYLYTAFWQYSRWGTPMMKNLAFADPTDPEALSRETEFLFGEHLLAAPVIKAGQKHQKVYLPEGKWYHYQNGEVFAGKQYLMVATPLDQSPLFVRAGAVIPHFPVMQYTGEKTVETLELHIYYSTKEVESHLYEDRGEGFDHHRGDYSLRTFATKGTARRFSVRVQKEGNRADAYSTCEVRVYGLPFKPVKCLSNDALVGITVEKLNNVPVYVLNLANEFNEFELN